jgi:translation initiation factor IF-2
MADSEQIRISKVIKELNIGLDSALEFLSSKGVAVEKNPNSKIDAGAYGLLLGQFSTDKKAKDEADAMLALKVKKEIVVSPAPEPVIVAIQETPKPEVPVEKKPEKVVIKATKKTLTKEEEADDVIRASVDGDNSVTVVGKIDLDALNSKTKPDKKTKAAKDKEKKDKEDAVIAEKAAAKEKGKTTAKTTKKKTEEKAVEEVVTPIANTEVVAEKPVSIDPNTNERIITADNTQSVAEENVHVTSYTKIEGPKVMGSIELPKPPEKKKEFAVSLPVTLHSPAIEVPKRLVTARALDPAVTPSASVTAAPPIVAFPETVADATLSAEAVA